MSYNRGEGRDPGRPQEGGRDPREVINLKGTAIYPPHRSNWSPKFYRFKENKQLNLPQVLWIWRIIYLTSRPWPRPRPGRRESPFRSGWSLGAREGVHTPDKFRMAAKIAKKLERLREFKLVNLSMKEWRLLEVPENCELHIFNIFASFNSL